MTLTQNPGTPVQDQKIHVEPWTVIESLRYHGERVRKEWADHGVVNNQHPISSKQIWIVGKLLIEASQGPGTRNISWDEAWNMVYWVAFNREYKP